MQTKFLSEEFVLTVDIERVVVYYVLLDWPMWLISESVGRWPATI